MENRSLLTRDDLFALRPVIVECSYNPHPDGPGPSAYYEYGLLVLRLPCTFNPTGLDEDKSPDNAWKQDDNWDLVLHYFQTGCLLNVVLFLGFIRSGSNAIAARAARDFKGSLYIFDFHMCDHDIYAKIAYLIALGFAYSQMSGFWDPHDRCREWDSCDARARTLARMIAEAKNKTTA